MKRNLILATSPLLLIFSCASIETQDENNTTSSVIKIDENEKFLNYLNDDWQKTLDDNPLFASYTGDKRQNNKICKIRFLSLRILITRNVKKKSLALTRSLQTEIKNYKRKSK